jgi:hypothetical protein
MQEDVQKLIYDLYRVVGAVEYHVIITQDEVTKGQIDDLLALAGKMQTLVGWLEGHQSQISG